MRDDHPRPPFLMAISSVLSPTVGSTFQRSSGFVSRCAWVLGNRSQPCSCIAHAWQGTLCPQPLSLPLSLPSSPQEVTNSITELGMRFGQNIVDPRQLGSVTIPASAARHLPGGVKHLIRLGRRGSEVPTVPLMMSAVLKWVPQVRGPPQVRV